jgi:NAD-reducing hydrogenase small subunit
MSKARIATIWLDGCSGCHMSLLDIDERILDLAGRIDLVYSPVVDAKEIPRGVDVGIVEGAVSSEEDVEKAKLMRARSRFLVALGDCAVNSNVPSMRNGFAVKDLMQRAYVENASCGQQIPDQVVPALMRRARPVHEIVKVDLHVPGCPPPADAIFFVLSELLEGRVPEPTALSKFG